ncbi:Cytosolic sulfotransferase 8 [Apostasia shenzhenica]|uniref:Sulfotransferase n=1 Tax=Apostasia shenzhenica TaxID=1088818 RepID=A0A2H9ZVK0_9ASPA|nr:Cytosolic sulfotransferase 8 [Apostasia shenzhenica]
MGELEYWRESKRRQEKVMFLKYEEMIEDPARVLRKMAEFLGCPFSEEEEEEGTVEKLVKHCSFKSLVNAEESKKASYDPWNGLTVKKSSFFRKGIVGDWAAHLSPEMARKMDAITGEKLKGSGLRL